MMVNFNDEKIPSGLGVSAEANFSAYCASKFGVIGLAGKRRSGQSVTVYS